MSEEDGHVVPVRSGDDVAADVVFFSRHFRKSLKLK